MAHQLVCSLCENFRMMNSAGRTTAMPISTFIRPSRMSYAFFVRCGLGTTMNAQDILEGRMNVEIGMAVVRPAEFIILKFSHKLQTS